MELKITNKILGLSLLLTASLSLMSCSKHIDCSSNEKKDASIREIMASLNEDKGYEFLVALGNIRFLCSNMNNSTYDTTKYHKLIDSKTANQIIAKGKQAIIKIAARNEIEKRYRAKDKAKKDRKELDKLLITDPVFNTLNYVTPTITLTTKNNTGHTISRVYFKAELLNTKTPLIPETLNCLVLKKGGMPPGESATWAIAPPEIWSIVELTDSTTLNMETVRLDGPNNELLYSSAKGFNRKDQEKLDKLLEENPEFAR